MLFRFLPELSALDADLREAFLEKLRVRWTHTSTALEGNTLTEGETFGVLRYGLTISGKSLADHNEVLGHSRALDLLYGWLAEARVLQAADLHALHHAVQTSVEVDYLKPVGAWKREPNSTLAKQGGKTVINDTYAMPEQVAALMQDWLAGFQQRRQDKTTTALEAYVWSHATFVRIHPYADGNGRMARLLANLPVIEKGRLPIFIPSERRLDYIEALATWQLTSGPPLSHQPLEGDLSRLQAFQTLCESCLEESNALLDDIRSTQDARHG
ncbi:Fic family protein [Prosthecobacter sp.]|uniref:Fic family protein n=1 Tax=Prosthecobacter sp. TaxID=1965333 RepID=UPI002AB9F7F9|nr:Fic family protein [Prosthecobacter sp.]MDZ4405177.1 Fic family protein [Prosthecobacter sp.]